MCPMPRVTLGVHSSHQKHRRNTSVTDNGGGAVPAESISISHQPELHQPTCRSAVSRPRSMELALQPYPIATLGWVWKGWARGNTCLTSRVPAPSTRRMSSTNIARISGWLFSVSLHCALHRSFDAYTWPPCAPVILHLMLSDMHNPTLTFSVPEMRK